jgi:hypothetical protein
MVGGFEASPMITVSVSRNTVDESVYVPGSHVRVTTSTEKRLREHTGREIDHTRLAGEPAIVSCATARPVRGYCINKTLRIARVDGLVNRISKVRLSSAIDEVWDITSNSSRGVVDIRKEPRRAALSCRKFWGERVHGKSM